MWVGNQMNIIYIYIILKLRDYMILVKSLKGRIVFYRNIFLAILKLRLPIFHHERRVLKEKGKG